jgi:hypothetical protein
MTKENETILGSLSAKYESGKNGAGTVSSGKGDAGGVSYGTYQMTSKGKSGGTVGRFLRDTFSGKKYANYFIGLQPGSSKFSEKWKEIAKTDKEFGLVQHNFIKITHFNILFKKVKHDLGLDVSDRSIVLQDVLWSTSVQHGGRTSIFNQALRGMDIPNMSDQDIIKAVYKERGRKNKDGSMTYFSRNSVNIQNGVSKRFKNEEKDALDILAKIITESDKIIFDEATAQVIKNI